MNNARTYLSTNLRIKELCVNIFAVLEASNLRGTLLQFENSYEELNANIFAMVGIASFKIACIWFGLGKVLPIR